MFEIVREKLQYPLKHWIRYSYGCEAPFKSGYVVTDLLHGSESNQVKSASFNFFDSNEGKSCSDSITSIVICLFTSGTLKSQQAICYIDDILVVIQNVFQQSTKDLIFLWLKKLDGFRRAYQTQGNIAK